MTSVGNSKESNNRRTRATSYPSAHPWYLRCHTRITRVSCVSLSLSWRGEEARCTPPSSRIHSMWYFAYGSLYLIRQDDCKNIFDGLQFYSKLFNFTFSSSSVKLATDKINKVSLRRLIRAARLCYRLGRHETRSRVFFTGCGSPLSRAAQFAYPPRLCPLCPKHAIKSAPPQLSTVSYANVGRKPYSPRVESERGERERKKERKNRRKGEKKRALGPGGRAKSTRPVPQTPTRVQRSTSVSA